MSDPLSDAVRAVTDGHVWLSRELFHQGHYPAVDVLGSISRVMADVAGAEHQRDAVEVRRLLAAYAEAEDLVRVGAYKPGASAETDRAVQALPLIRAFLAQRVEEPSAFDRTVRQLNELVRRIAQPRRGPAAVRPAARAGT